MKQIILIFCLGLILNSCKKDTVGIPCGATDVTFELKFSGESPPNTRSIGDVINNDKIDYVTVLVFEDGGSNNYLYRRSGIEPVNSEFTVDLIQTDDPVRIHVFINPNSDVNVVNYNGQTETEVISNLVTDLDLNHASTDAFPMHGMLSLSSITDDMTVNNPIYLLRAIARVDMNTNAIPENIFKLEGVSVYRTPSTGCWVSNYVINQNGNPATPTVTDATMPLAFTTMTSVLSDPVVVIDNKIENQLFVYENDANLSSFSRIVMAGYFNSDTEIAYYPIDFETQNQDPIDILRNHHYTVNITNVTGSGYENELDAANGESIDVEANIIVWNSMGVDGSIDPIIELTAPSKVLLDHTTNGGSYTRTVPYTSNRDVQVYIDGVEVLYPGNNTTIDLDIPAAQSNWLTTATWYPINKLEGVFEFTHSTSSYNNPESYIVTLTNGGITRNIEVFVDSITIEAEQAANCYIIPMSGKTIGFPATDQTNIFWAATGDGNEPNNVIGSNTEWYAEVIWADFDYSGKLTIQQNGVTASDFGMGSENLNITVAPLTKPGNVIVGLKKKGATTGTTDYIWSWHLWITDYDPDVRTDASEPWATNKTFATIGGQVHSYADAPGTALWSGDYNGAVIMDRNLGAIVSTGGDGAFIPYATTGVDAFGLHYQWGRKDPFPHADGESTIPIQTWGRVTAWPSNNGGPKTKAYVVHNPHYFITASNSADWQSPKDAESWKDEKGTKSLYDPCPAGWKVPQADVWSNFDVGSHSFIGVYGLNTGYLYTEGNHNTWYSHNGYVSSVDGVNRDAGGFATYWSSTSYANDSYFMYIVSGYMLPKIQVSRGFGFGVRCLQE